MYDTNKENRNKEIRKKKMQKKIESTLKVVDTKSHIEKIHCDELCVINKVCESLKIDINHLFLPLSFPYVSNGRYILSKWYRENTKYKLREIADKLWVSKGRNHTYVIHGAEKAQGFIDTEEPMKKCWEEIKNITVGDIRNVKYIKRKKQNIERAKNLITTKDLQCQK